MKEINFLSGYTLEECIIKLLESQAKGIPAKGKFNGYTLYSEGLTMDGGFLTVIGVTKKEWDGKQRRDREEYDKRKKDHEAKIPKLTKEYMEKGRNILSEEYWESWNKIVPIRLHDLYEGMELDCCLQIVAKLNQGSPLLEAKDLLDKQDHSGGSYGLVRSMVSVYCSRGEEFKKICK